MHSFALLFSLGIGAHFPSEARRLAPAQTPQFPLLQDILSQFPQLQNLVSQFPPLQDFLSKFPPLQEFLSQIPELSDLLSQFPQLQNILQSGDFSQLLDLLKSVDLSQLQKILQSGDLSQLQKILQSVDLSQLQKLLKSSTLQDLINLLPPISGLPEPIKVLIAGICDKVGDHIPAELKGKLCTDVNSVSPTYPSKSSDTTPPSYSSNSGNTASAGKDKDAGFADKEASSSAWGMVLPIVAVLIVLAICVVCFILWRKNKYGQVPGVSKQVPVSQSKGETSGSTRKSKKSSKRHQPGKPSTRSRSNLKGIQ